MHGAAVHVATGRGSATRPGLDPPVADAVITTDRGVALAVVTGGLLGLLAGYAGGRTDGLVMRLMDAVLSFPPLVLALALVVWRRFHKSGGRG